MAVLATQLRGPVLLITLDRPAVRNALSRELRAQLAAALRAADDDDAVRAVVITGSGSSFCAGLDLEELKASVGQPHEAALEDSQALAALFSQIIELGKPVVAAVNGPAVAGGAGLVNACDVAVAAQGARFGYTEARIGFVAALVAALLERQVGAKVRRELLLGAEIIDAQRALALGLVNEVVPDDAVVERAIELATRMARNAPGSLAETKRLLASIDGLPLTAALQAAALANAARRSSPELAEGVASFLEKRRPSWQPPTERD